MSGRWLVLVFSMIGLGLLGGWFLWGSQDLVVERLEVPVEGGAAETNPLGEFFHEWAGKEELEGALLGFCVLDEEGEVVFASPLAETALCPASALKILTTGAAFGLLGEDFRFETSLLASGGISAAGVVAGDLILKGGGDPTLMEEDLRGLAEMAVNKGLKRVEGVLRVDASIFPQAPVSDHWVWGDLGNAYGAGAFGVNVGRNTVRLVFDAGAREGNVASYLRTEPDIYGHVKWQVAVTTGPVGSGDGVMIYSTPYGERVEARGTVPLGARGFAVRGAVPDPPRLAGEILEKELEKRGVVFGRALAPANLPEVEIARHESAVLPEIVDHMQEVSDNLEAQCLFLMMGVTNGADPAVAMRDYWEGMGVSFKGLRLLDGSGLARATMIRPLDLARANFLARQAGYGERFLASLPASTDGSVRSKRGAMSGVRTEVGFVNRRGKEYIFALMGNGLGSVDFWKLRESLLDEVGR